MSKPAGGSKQCALDHYAQLCLESGITPTTAQIEQIASAVGEFDKSAANSLVYGSLYFIRRSAIVFQDGYLLVGWIHKSDGTKQKIWFRHIRARSHVYHHDGMCLSVYLSDRDARLCDEWHPSLDAICKPWQTSGHHTRYKLYAMLNAIIKIMNTDPSPPSIEDTMPNDESSETEQHETQNKTESVQSKPLPKTRSRKKRNLENEDYDPAVVTSTRPSIKDRNKRARSSAIVDPIEPDPEELVEIKSRLAPPTTKRDKHERTTSAEEELLLMLQSKKVSEIEVMLATRSGQIPDWIRRVMQEEMEKKKVRDLDMVRNLF